MEAADLPGKSMCFKLSQLNSNCRMQIVNLCSKPKMQYHNLNWPVKFARSVQSSDSPLIWLGKMLHKVFWLQLNNHHLLLNISIQCTHKQMFGLNILLYTQNRWTKLFPVIFFNDMTLPCDICPKYLLITNRYLFFFSTVSPYLKSLSMVSSNKLLHLLEAFSTPWFLFSNPANHHLVFFLLEVFNNIIQYQFDGKKKLRRGI